MEAVKETAARLMTSTEVAEYLRVSKASVYRLVKDKGIPVSSVGRQLRFRRDSIDRWLARKEGDSYEP